MTATLTLTLRGPRQDEGAAIWELARDSERLDLNTPYAYMLWARDFHKSTLVADVDGELVGFIIGFMRPDEPTTLMVWQVAVDMEHRGHGIAGRMLEALVERTGARALETTVTNANEASTRLFAALAARHGAEHTISDLFEPEHFPATQEWEAEKLHRIEPLSSSHNELDNPTTTIEEDTTL
ncbi:MAG: diaminobutyrate acetyltransferase [Gulosibacter sp.]|uniref:diaminobutyrate acetyltransferase n=1 Tax=Gulosibacter sp. TaxID=2817531 RepID=UPI003F8E9159